MSPGNERSRPPITKAGQVIAHHDTAMINQSVHCTRYSIVELLCPFCDRRHAHIWQAAEPFPVHIPARCSRALLDEMRGVAS